MNRLAMVYLREMDSYIPICSASELQQGDQYDEIGTFTWFNLFGFAIFIKFQGFDE